MLISWDPLWRSKKSTRISVNNLYLQNFESYWMFTLYKCMKKKKTLVFSILTMQDKQTVNHKQNYINLNRNCLTRPKARLKMSQYFLINSFINIFSLLFFYLSLIHTKRQRYNNFCCAIKTNINIT